MSCRLGAKSVFSIKPLNYLGVNPSRGGIYVFTHSSVLGGVSEPRCDLPRHPARCCRLPRRTSSANSSKSDARCSSEVVAMAIALLSRLS